MCQFDVTLVFPVDMVAALGGFQIDVGHLGVLAQRFPKHVSLIVAQVNAMHMGARVFTLNVVLRLHCRCGEERK